MPYKDKAKAAESWRRHYRANREKMVARSKAYTAKNRELIRQLIDEAKSKPCMDCGKSYPPYVMDLDHRDPNDKDIDPARMVARSWGRERVMAEIAKCDVVCANCHRTRTYGTLAA